ncbi:MAG TPA: IS110 family transposase [Candidatus Acidoferrales bacterium]|jgi:transposase|nr:IS110 family transposase [Candidatus Acidoferrales bacterium]
MAKTANTPSHKATRKKETVSKSRSTPVAAERKAPKPEGKANRGDRKRRARKREAIENRPVLEPNAAGIDIGAREVYVAVPPDRDEQPVRIFDTFTADLHELANWLTACGITTVAMESTGVYWIPVYEILDTHGIRPCVVNARHMKNVPGRRTDWHECQWIQFLHSVGLLRAAFRPEAEVCALRAVIRHRGELVQMAAKHVQHMHKALTQMNLQIQHVITDLTGLTGLAIVDAILEGERNPSRLAKLRDPRVKASQETIEKSLVGNWLPEHLFTLKQSRRLYAEYQREIAECDGEIERLVGCFQPRVDPEVKPLPPDQKKNRNYAKSRKRRTRPKSSTRKFDLRTEVYKLFGVDVTQIPGLEFLALQLFSEVGRDMSRWASAACFVSWLALCPDNDISGGRVLWRGKRSVHNRAGQLFRMAAYALDRSPTPLGDYLRRMKAKLGPKAAHTATAHKIAVIFYTMIKNQSEYDGTIWEQRDAQRRQRHTASLKRQAQRLGYKLTPIEKEAA